MTQEHRPDSELDSQGPPGAPRWVKVLGLAALALIVLVVILQIAGIGPRHGPNMHSSSVRDVADVTGRP